MQIKTRPPTFFVFVNRKNLLSANFEEFMRNCLNKEFGFQGVPVRLLIRDSRTQYAAKRQSKLSQSASRILERIRQYQKMKRNPTYRKRLIGSKHLFQKGFRAKTKKDWQRY
mmetsp:Transcript_1048/g.1926  ORF Transcript_1048/g.1926 Transcript_1048/m.1926 type:complete len:112 (+) Transcript_1048:1935-2270(+)